MKTYILMLSKVFPTTHPRCGEPTDFKKKRKDGSKKHTIRGNAEFWEHRAEEINAGRAILSIRQWSGKPYEKGSHQIVIGEQTRLGTQRITLGCYGAFPAPWATVQNGDKQSPVEIDRIAANDGLSTSDFISWFNLRKRKDNFNGVILHFTDYRY